MGPVDRINIDGPRGIAVFWSQHALMEVDVSHIVMVGSLKGQDQKRAVRVDERIGSPWIIRKGLHARCVFDIMDCIIERPKERRVYTDEDVDEDEIEGRRKFSVDDKLTSPRYNSHFVKELRGDELTLKYFQEHGFTTPILVKEKTGLGMRVPSQNFKVSDVKQCVGSRRQLDVMDVITQKGLEMSMKEWVRYYENRERERLLNVISLEFSHSRLENYVEQPLVVRQLDWVDGAWPRYLKESQTECTNIIERMKYPKVQKYCLMSVKGCYTDFHIDMGGTSVWYHVLHGCKIFWLIPPTENNLQLYENWVLSGKQGDMFFADKVEKCQRISLHSGWTFFIPTGWIHAVYTPEDSLIFGGNWLHSFNIPMQLRISEVEDRTRVPQKFRYPFFQELHWYLLERYSTCVMNRTHRLKSEEELREEQDNREQKVKPRRSPADSGDEKSDCKLSQLTAGQPAVKNITEIRDEVGTSPRNATVDDPQYVNSPRPFRPKSPQSPSRPMSPRQPTGIAKKSNEENTAPRSPKVGRTEARSPRPSETLDGATRALRQTRSDSSGSGKDSKKSDQSPSKKNEQADPKKNKSESSIKTYFNQSGLIKPVSVKLENCMLAGEKSKNLLEGGAMSAGTPGSAAAATPVMGKKPWTHLTQWELKGLRTLVKWLEEVQPNKRSVPKDIPDPDGLIRDIKKMLLDHATDDPRLAVSGEVILRWPPRKLKKMRPMISASKGPKSGVKKPGLAKGKDKDASSVRRRRVRCKVCEPCTRDDCRECHFCMDMKKYGGAGRMKQSCKSRQCMMPVLPTSAVCAICGKDERIKTEGACEPYTTLMECGICWEIVHPVCVRDASQGHRMEGNVNEDLPNSWECPKCCGDGKQGQSKPRVVKGLLLKSRVESRQSSTSSDGSSSRTEVEEETSPSHEDLHVLHRRPGRPRVERDENNQKVPGRRGRRPRERNSSEESVSFRKRLKAEEESPRMPVRGRVGRPPLSASKAGISLGRRTSRGREHVRHSPKPGPSYNTDTSEYSDDDLRSRSTSKEDSPMRSRMKLGGVGEDDTSSIEGSLSLSSRKRKDPALVKMSGAPMKQVKIVLQRYVVRPAPIPPPPKHFKITTGFDHALDQEIWRRVFQYLNQKCLCSCMRVCRTWNRWCIDRRLWSKIIVSRRKITRDVLVGIVRRQPINLDVSWTNLNRKQLEWLAARLPQLKHLSLAGNSWAAVCALCSSSCPLLYTLDLKWVSGIRDSCIVDLVSPPTDHRPGVDDTVSRLHRVTKLELAGSDVTNKSLELITLFMPKLTHLDISFCTKVTDEGIAILSSDIASSQKNMTYLDLTGCNQLTDECFTHLKTFTDIQLLIVESCPKITMGAFHDFAQKNKTVNIVI